MRKREREKEREIEREREKPRLFMESITKGMAAMSSKLFKKHLYLNLFNHFLHDFN